MNKSALKLRNRRERRKARKAERAERQMNAARFWRWLPDWSWKRVIVVGAIMVDVLLLLSWCVDKPAPDLYLRAIAVVIGTVAMAAIVYLKEKSLAK